jgi:RNA recognition motif-containing protein
MDIYIGNLNKNLDENSLVTLFGVFGTVISATVVKDKETGNSKGFGFVKMHNAIEAQRAIDEMHGRTVAGHDLVVYEAHSNNPESSPRNSQMGVPAHPGYYEKRVEKVHELTDQAEYSTEKTKEGFISIKFDRK